MAIYNYLPSAKSIFLSLIKLNTVKMIKPMRSLFLLLFLGLSSLSVAITIPAIAQTPSTINQRLEQSKNLDLIDLGQAAYDAGRYTEAVKVWQQAEHMYHLQSDRFNRASSLNYLALAHQELGQWQLATKEIAKSLELLQQTKLQDQNLALLGQALNTQGSLQLATGKPEAALETWQQAASKYQAAQDELGVIGSKINQSQALQTLGLHRRAQKLLEEVRQQLNQQSDPVIKAKVLQSLGTTLQTIGNLSQSQEVLQESLAIAKKFNLLEETSNTLLSLGNTARLLENNQAAIEFYQQASSSIVRPLTKLEAKINLLGMLIATEEWQSTEALLPQIQANLQQLGTSTLVLAKDDREIAQQGNTGQIKPAPLRRTVSPAIDLYPIANLASSRPLVYAQVNLAKNLINLQAKNSFSPNLTNPIPDLLQQTLLQTKELEDKRAESYVLGTLGHYYEQQQQWQTGQQFTEQALNLAQTLNATDMTYQWQWQLGRLLQAQGDNQSAIAPYTEAVNNLQSLRSSLVAISTDAQFSFRKSVEPVYRELVGLLLDDPNQEQLQQARNVIESLQLAELENFFQEACLDAEPKQIDQVDPKAAVIYPIILRDHIAVILSLPDKSLKHYTTYLPQAEIDNTIDNLHQSFYPFFSNQQRMELSQKVYDWLIKPAEADLVKNGVETLAFVLDGNLRNIPMSALYDGNQYAIEKYNIALTPGLQLLASPGLKTRRLQAIVAGVSESNQGFAALPGVKEEITQISSQVSSQTLLNDSFTDANLQNQLQQTDAPIVHLATHGQFSSTPEDTFIVTWNDRIQVNELETLLRSRDINRVNPIELMVLSACETATGDDRAALGMAGMAVRSGARSTLATLWSVKDESTAELIDKFYQQLLQSQPNVNKAAALRQAQLTLIKSKDFSHPFYWSPFVLIGNWL
ncbi:MAG: CHAT domain-containing protein [Waterburya sp.]